MLCATGLTAVIRPPTVLPLGSCTLTGSPTTASLCLVASRSTVTTSLFDVVCRIGWALAAPELDALAPRSARSRRRSLPHRRRSAPPRPPPPPPPPPPERRRAAAPAACAGARRARAERDDAPAEPSSFFSSSVSAFSNASRTAADEGVLADGFDPEPG